MSSFHQRPFRLQRSGRINQEVIQIPPAAKKKNDRLTDEERACVRALEILAEKWPETLILFAAGPDTNTVHILKTDDNGDPIRLPEERGGGYDPKAIVGQVIIPNDGGEW